MKGTTSTLCSCRVASCRPRSLRRVYPRRKKAVVASLQGHCYLLTLLLHYYATTTAIPYYYKYIRAYAPLEDQCRCRAHHQLQGWRNRGCRGCKGRSLPNFEWWYKSKSCSFSSPCKVEKILKGSLDLIPSPSVKIQIMGMKITLGVKAIHCWTLSTHFWKQKVCWHHPAMFCLTTSNKLSRQ